MGVNPWKAELMSGCVRQRRVVALLLFPLRTERVQNILGTAVNKEIHNYVREGGRTLIHFRSDDS